MQNTDHTRHKVEDWKQSVVFLTGASSGIGASLAVAMGRKGARVVLAARREEALLGVAEQVTNAGGEAMVMPLDVADRAAVEAAVELVRARWGAIDCVVANAGIGINTPVTRFDVGAIEQTMRVNFLGVVYVVGAVIDEMVQRGRGHIVGVSSLAAWRGFPVNSAYAASKAAVSSWLEGLRIELTPRGVHVTTVHPGFVKTDMTAKNNFKMPFLMEPNDAADVILRGIEDGAREVNFPLPMSGLMRVAKWMPNAVYDRVMGKAR